MSGLGQWPVPPAERRRLRFPFQNQQCQRAGSKSGTSVLIQTRRAARLRGPPGVGSAVSIEPRTPCQRPLPTLCSACAVRCGRQQLSAPALNLTAADVVRLTRGGGFYGTATPVSTEYFGTCCQTSAARLQSAKLRGSAVSAAFASPVPLGKDAQYDEISDRTQERNEPAGPLIHNPALQTADQAVSI